MEKFSVKKPFTVLVAVVMILILGFVAVTKMDTNLLPNVNTPYLMVVTVYPGASPERVESEVSDVLQNALTVPGVEKITATSAENYSLLLMKFVDDTDMNSALVQVSNKLDQAKSDLPDTALTPSVIQYSMNMNAFMTVAVSREGSSVYELSDFIKNTMTPYVQRKGGVSSVSASGLVEQLVQVQLNQEKVDDINEKLMELIDSQLEAAHAQLEEAEAKIKAGRAEYDKQFKNFGNTVSNTVMGTLSSDVGSAVEVVRKQAEALLQSVNNLIAVVKEPEVQQALIEVQAGLQRVLDKFNSTGMRDIDSLIEIVSEPDMRSAEEVIAYLEKLRMTIQYLGASDCKMQEGSMRADVNLSVREKGTKEFGTRTEMKNIGSFKAIARAIEAETARQIDLIESGEKVVQETRRWNDDQGYSYAMRSKEDAQDYPYFPEPDLVPIVISDEWLQRIKDSQPELREAKRQRYQDEFGLPEYDANILTSAKKMADVFEATTAICNKPKKVSNWLMGETMRILKEQNKDPEDIAFSPENLAKLIELTDAGTINGNVAKEVFEQIFAEDIDPDKYVEEHGLKTVNDEGALRDTIAKVIEENPQSVEDYRNGKEKAIGFLVGQTMKAMKGKANPGMVNKILKELL